MDLLWKILLVFVACAEAENPTAVPVELGKNVTLICSLPGNNKHWYIEIRSQVRGRIAETFTSDPDESGYYLDTPLKNKYIAMANQLVITNITAEDYRLYYCGQKKNSSIIFDTFRLVSVAPSNDSEANCQQQHLNTPWQSELIIYSLLALTALLLSVIIGLVCPTLSLKRKKCNYEVTEQSPSMSTTLETPQYEEIQFRAA